MLLQRGSHLFLNVWVIKYLSFCQVKVAKLFIEPPRCSVQIDEMLRFHPQKPCRRHYFIFILLLSKTEPLQGILLNFDNFSIFIFIRHKTKGQSIIIHRWFYRSGCSLWPQLLLGPSSKESYLPWKPLEHQLALLTKLKPRRVRVLALDCQTALRHLRLEPWDAFIGFH